MQIKYKLSPRVRGVVSSTRREMAGEISFVKVNVPYGKGTSAFFQDSLLLAGSQK